MRERPNIVLINCDDLGWGDLGCYGHPKHSTPWLDRLAEEGMRFSDFYVASPVCSPSRGALLTGCYPSRIGFSEFEGEWVLFPGQPVGLSTEEDTIAGVLKQRGYATKIVGKWHCGDQPEFLPTRHGFDEYYGIPYSNDMGRQAGRKTGFPPLPLMRDETVVEEQPDQASVTARYTEECIRFMRSHAEEPFFLYFAHMYVHLPLYAPKRFLEESSNGSYGAAVAAIDWSVGMIMRELEALGLDEETLVLFTSDNGSRNDTGASNGPLRGTKGTTWEGGQRVPLIARLPGTIPPGTLCGGVASALDLFPTIAGFAGAKTDTQRPIDGRDIRSLLTDPRSEEVHEAFFFQHFGALEAVRAGDWKLHFSKRGETCDDLYNLREDIGEQQNRRSERPDVVERLSALAEGFRDRLGDSSKGQTGSEVRPIGRVESPSTLTGFDPTYPYYMAEYDLSDAG
jgi:arylsulfatase A-like enzyme